MSHPAFDMTVQHRDAKSGRVVRVDPYRQFSSKKFGTRLERPVGSGNCFYGSGEPAGRVTQDENGNHVHDITAEHIAWNPKTPNEQITEAKDMQISDLEAKIQKLEAAHIKKEAEGHVTLKRGEKSIDEDVLGSAVG